MRYCVYGLGAIGGVLAARLSAAGVDVSAVARGRTLQEVRRGGLGYAATAEAAPSFQPLSVTDDPADVGPVDCVIVSVKSTALPDIADGVASMLGPDTVVLSAMNGIPWWFLDGLDHSGEPEPLSTVDPHGRLRAGLPPARTVGAVLHFNASTDSPGVMRRRTGNRIVLGSAADASTVGNRLDSIHDDLTRAGFHVERSERIQDDVWFKLLGNLSLNPITALTGATTDQVLDDDLLCDFVLQCMREVVAVGDKLGIRLAQTPEERIVVTRSLGSAVPSMLQDVRAGRALELDNLTGAVAELGARVGTPTPATGALFGLIRLFGRVHGLYPAPSTP